MKAIIRIETQSQRGAVAIAKSLRPDDATSPSGLVVKTSASGKRVVSKIMCRGKLETFVSTVDELLCAIQIAENNLRALGHGRKI